MARGRMLNKNVATDEKVQLLSDISALLYTLLIPFQDKSGRFYANPSIIKGNIVPYRKSFTLRRIGLCLKEIEAVGLVFIYGKDRQYMQFKGFLKNNKPHPHEAESTIPSQEDVGRMSGECRVNLDELNLDKIRLDKSSHAEEIVDDSGKQAKMLLDFFFNKYLEYRKVKYIVKGAKDMKLLKTLLKDLTLEQIQSLMEQFFKFQDDFLSRTDYGIGVFFGMINKLRQVEQAVVAKEEKVEAYDVRAEEEAVRRQREEVQQKKDNALLEALSEEERIRVLGEAEAELRKVYGSEGVITQTIIKIEAIKLLKAGKKPF